MTSKELVERLEVITGGSISDFQIDIFRAPEQNIAASSRGFRLTYTLTGAQVMRTDLSFDENKKACFSAMIALINPATLSEAKECL